MNAVAAMSLNNTILSLGAYNPFRVDTALKQSQLHAPVLVRGNHISYWVALACAIVVVYILRSSRSTDAVDAPFYNVGRLKWMTHAEDLVRDSYNKVITTRPRTVGVGGMG